MAFQPSSLYYTSAILYAATIPKHTSVGLQKVDPAVKTISGVQHDKMRKLLTPTWFHCNLWLLASALISVRWARNGGPKSLEDKTLAWAQLAIGAWTGWHYYKHQMYVGLGCLWAAPAASVAALLWQESELGS